MKLTNILISSWEYGNVRYTVNWAWACMLSFGVMCSMIIGCTQTQPNIYIEASLFIICAIAAYLEVQSMKKGNKEVAGFCEYKISQDKFLNDYSKSIKTYRESIIDTYMSRHGDSDHNLAALQDEILSLFKKLPFETKATLMLMLYDTLGRPHCLADKEQTLVISTWLQTVMYEIADKMKISVMQTVNKT